MVLARAAYLLSLILIFMHCGVEMKSQEPRPEGETIRIFNLQKGEAEEVQTIRKTDEEWRRLLTPEQYLITRQKGTETPSTEKCDIPKEEGIYQCVCCGTDLFAPHTKFESGSGWPSFWNPVSELNIKTQVDTSLSRRRIEVLCARCDAHLGHVFDDGPPPTHKRYCINSVALKFIERDR